MNNDPYPKYFVSQTSILFPNIATYPSYEMINVVRIVFCFYVTWNCYVRMECCEQNKYEYIVCNTNHVFYTKQIYWAQIRAFQNRQIRTNISIANINLYVTLSRCNYVIDHNAQTLSRWRVISCNGQRMLGSLASEMHVHLEPQVKVINK